MGRSARISSAVADARAETVCRATSPGRRIGLLRVLPNGGDQAGTRLIICGVPEGFACKFPLVQTGFFETAAKVAAIEVIRALFEHNLLVEDDEIGCAVQWAARYCSECGSPIFLQFSQ